MKFSDPIARGLDLFYALLQGNEEHLEENYRPFQTAEDYAGFISTMEQLEALCSKSDVVLLEALTTDVMPIDIGGTESTELVIVIGVQMEKSYPAKVTAEIRFNLRQVNRPDKTGWIPYGKIHYSYKERTPTHTSGATSM